MSAVGLPPRGLAITPKNRERLEQILTGENGRCHRYVVSSYDELCNVARSAEKKLAELLPLAHRNWAACSVRTASAPRSRDRHHLYAVSELVIARRGGVWWLQHYDKREEWDGTDENYLLYLTDPQHRYILDKLTSRYRQQPINYLQTIGAKRCACRG